MIFSYDNLIAITLYFFVASSQFLVVFAILHRYSKENRIKILAGATSPPFVHINWNTILSARNSRSLRVYSDTCFLNCIHLVAKASQTFFHQNKF